MPEEKNQLSANDNKKPFPKGRLVFDNHNVVPPRIVNPVSESPAKRKIKPVEFFKPGVATMQDDMANLISAKNHKKNQPSNSASSQRDIQRNLTEVYTNGDGQIPDLSRLEKMQRPLWKTIVYSLIVVLVVLFLAGATGFYFFSNMSGDSFTNERVFVKIQPPMTVVSGQESAYTISITNKEKVNLYNVELELFYPDGLTYVSADPGATGDQKNMWEFSALNVGETKQIQITGKMVAELKSTQTLKAVLSFKPANLNAIFRQEAIVDMAISSSTLSLEIAGPDKILANQPTEYSLKYQNNSQDDLSDLRLLVEYPDGFVVKGMDASSTLQVVPPAQTGLPNGTLTQASGIWTISLLKAGASGQLKIRGDYSKSILGGNKEFKAQMQLKRGTDYSLQSEQILVTSVVKDQLSLQLIINGSGEDQPISFGDLLVYSLHYKNTGQQDLKNVTISAIVNSQIIDGKTLNDAQKGVVNKNIITWGGQQIPKLLRLGAGEEGEIVWSVRVRDSSVINDGSVNSFTVESSVEGKADQEGDLAGQSIVKSKSIINSINSDLSLNASVSYYDADNIALGSGPIEPKVDEKSSYSVKISLSNNLHDITGLSAVATLPKDAIWDAQENHNTGNVNYNAQTRKLTWTISRLPKSANEASVSFSVGIKPTDADFGKILILVSDITLTAKDGNTGADINKTVKAVTTAFDDPIVGQVKGIVQ